MRTSSVDQIILDTLSHEHLHLTSHQVYEEIRDRLPAVNPSTVYRALDRLVSQGKISVSDMGTGAAVYETLSEGIHHHLVCEKCGAVITIDPQDVNILFDAIAQKKHFKTLTNHLVLFGICEHCQHAAESPSDNNGLPSNLSGVA
ncbi:MAG: transcriptional repressor [Anaerolineaceae bacterium]